MNYKYLATTVAFGGAGFLAYKSKASWIGIGVSAFVAAGLVYFGYGLGEKAFTKPSVVVPPSTTAPATPAAASADGEIIEKTPTATVPSSGVMTGVNM